MAAPQVEHALTVLKDSLRLNKMTRESVASGTVLWVTYSKRIKELQTAIAILENEVAFNETADRLEEDWGAYDYYY